ncbi:hypothetical protein M9H77_12665 [Catharanthus roseus]|uniref:Uncharacterized protein n=1 Tax=Catharanthus roseus TaxID=4058 RepID=A0ACC0BI08_CATRO|nr:hypothetical protein M9H77_12665 [Catharanthus roseus]
MGINVRIKDGKYGRYASICILSFGHVPRKLVGSTSQGLQEPLPNTSVVEESKKDEYLLENKNEFEEGEPKIENENFVESHEINLLTHETNFVLVDNSLCMQESWKQPKENDDLSLNSREISRTLKESNPNAMKKRE